MTGVHLLFHQEGMARHKLDSINDFARQGYNLRIRCLRCDYTVDAEAVSFMQDVYRHRGPRRIEDLEPRMKCGECGHRGAIISPTAREF